MKDAVQRDATKMDTSNKKRKNVLGYDMSDMASAADAIASLNLLSDNGTADEASGPRQNDEPLADEEVYKIPSSPPTPKSPSITNKDEPTETE